MFIFLLFSFMLHSAASSDVASKRGVAMAVDERVKLYIPQGRKTASLV